MIYGNLSVMLKKVSTRKFVFIVFVFGVFVFVFWGLCFRVLGSSIFVFATIASLT